MRQKLIKFLDRIRDYQRESGNNIGYDDRESSEFVDIYLSEKDSNDVHSLLGEVTAAEKAMIIIALNHLKQTTYDSWDNCEEVQRIKKLVEKIKKF